MKKAQSLLFTAAMMVAAAVVLATLLSLVDRYNDKDGFAKSIIVKDLAILTDSLYAAPGTVTMIYTRDLPGTNVKFTQDSIYLDDFRSSYSPSEEKEDTVFNEPPRLLFQKVGSKVQVATSEEELSKNAFNLHCPSVDTAAKLTDHRIALDAQHGGVDPGLVGSDREEAQLSQVITRGFMDRNVELSSSYILTRPLDMGPTAEATVSERTQRTQSATMLISFGVGTNDDTTREEVVAYIPPSSQKSRKLACSILNSLIDDFTLDSASIQESTNPLFLEEGPSVIFDVGNIHNTQAGSLLNSPGSVGAVMYEGVVDYLQ